MKAEENVPEIICSACLQPKKLVHYKDGSIYASLHIPLTFCKELYEIPDSSTIFPKGKFFFEDGLIVERKKTNE